MPAKAPSKREAQRWVRRLMRTGPYHDRVYAWRYYRHLRYAGPEPKPPEELRSILGAMHAHTIRLAIRVAMGLHPERAKPAPATFIGFQERSRGAPIALYNLTKGIPGHPRGSTVSAETLEAKGYTVPPARNPTRRRYRHRPLRSERGIDPRSIRTVRSGRSRVIVGCRKGKYKRGKCTEGTRAVSLLTPRNWPCSANPDDDSRPRGRATVYRDLIESRKLTPAELDVLEAIVTAHPNMTIDGIERSSGDEFDLRFEGWREGYRYGAWLPLAAIADLTRWTTPAVAKWSDYPEMAIQGDWSGIRDSDATTIWDMFYRLVLKPQKGKGGKVIKFRRNPPRRGRRGGSIYPDAVLVGEGGRAVLYGRHANGKLYKHVFGRGRKSIHSLPGGDVRLRARGGRMWDYF